MVESTARAGPILRPFSQATIQLVVLSAKFQS